MQLSQKKCENRQRNGHLDNVNAAVLPGCCRLQLDVAVPDGGGLFPLFPSLTFDRYSHPKTESKPKNEEAVV